MKKVTLELIYETLLKMQVNTAKSFNNINRRFDKLEDRMDKSEVRTETLDRDLNGTMDYMTDLIPDLVTNDRLEKLFATNKLKYN